MYIATISDNELYITIMTRTIIEMMCARTVDLISGSLFGGDGVTDDLHIGIMQFFASADQY